MSEEKSLFAKLMNQVFPRVPNFFGMLTDQCEVLLKSTQALVEFMESGGSEEKALLVRELEHQGDDLKARNMAMLAEAFATQLDREDMFRAVTSVDMILNYAKTTVREMELLGIKPDQHTVIMANLLREGAVALHRGYSKLSVDPPTAEEDALAVAKAERNVEKAYRQAITELFNAQNQMEPLQSPQAKAEAMQYVMDTFKRREIYRHLSNTADQLAHAGVVLHDIVVQS